MSLDIRPFVKRPVQVDAVKVTEGNVAEVAEWCGGIELTDGPPMVLVKTLEGSLAAYVGSWVVRGIAGEFYPVRDDIFQQTYQSADTLTEA